MSIAVDLDQLATTLAQYPVGYLLTTGKRGVKALSITATVIDGRVDIPVGSGGTADNLARDPRATLLFPPATSDGYTLLVDGTASATTRGFALQPVSAVLHRSER